MDDLKIGLGLGYWGKHPEDQTRLVLAAEDCGFDSVWAGEAYGSDALTPLTWYAGVLEVHDQRLRARQE